MKKISLLKLALFTLVLSVFSLSSCIETVETPEVDKFKVLTDYLKTNSLDLNDMSTNWVIDAAGLNAAGLSNHFIIDIRTAEDYAKGHIDGAVNSTLANILVTAKDAGTKPIVVACYTGQTAAVGHVALRLSGYTTCKILKWGMSGWNPVFDKWTANISDRAKENANWSTTNTTKTPVVFNYPKIEAQDTTAMKILTERIQMILDKGFVGVNAADVLAAPENYFIVNYWTEADVNTYGHIKGAYRLNEDLTFAADGIKNLDPDAAVTVYCWTGQTSALVAAYLTVRGYDANGIKFGTNAMINSDLQKNKWTTSANFPYVVK
jgi:rhodanese-related sulfurtransferase